MTRYIDFKVERSDFDINGLFPLCEALAVEFSTNLHGFQIESVRIEHADGSLHPVPVFISDYIGAWAMTPAGLQIIQRAYEAELSEREDYAADDRAEWDHQFLPAAE